MTAVSPELKNMTIIKDSVGNIHIGQDIRVHTRNARGHNLWCPECEDGIIRGRYTTASIICTVLMVIICCPLGCCCIHLETEYACDRCDNVMS